MGTDYVQLSHRGDAKRRKTETALEEGEGTASWVMEATQEVATSEEELFTTWEKQG